MSEQAQPFFFGIGTQKGGTTSLHDMLAQHPDVFLPAQKETKFLIRKYEGSMAPYWQDYFSAARPGQLCGEIDPDYMYYGYVAERILQHFGRSPKFIVSLRQPVDRAVSSYQMAFARGLEKRPFAAAIDYEMTQLRPLASDAFSYEKNHKSYIHKGLYAGQLRRYIELFGRESLLVLLFEEDLVQRPAETLARVQAFLGLRPQPLAQPVHSNKAQAVALPALNQWLRSEHGLKKAFSALLPRAWRKQAVQALYRLNRREAAPPAQIGAAEKAALFERYFAEDVAELEALIGRDLAAWRPR